MPQVDIQTLFDLLKDSVGIEAAEKMIYEAIKDANLSAKTFYSIDEFSEICEVLKKKGGYVKTIATIATTTAHKNIYFEKELVKEKKEKEDLARLNEILEYKVEERTKQLSENINRIENINKELDSYTYVVSHDLKEPIRAISAFSGFLAGDYKDKLDETGLNYIDRIRANAMRIQNIVEDFLEVSYIDKKINSFENVDLEEVINEANLRLENKTNWKKPDIVVKGKLPIVVCNRAGLIDVFANLISNAVKFADKDPPRVEIGWSENEDFYEFYVQDNGPGIDEQYFDKIFGIFQRLGKMEDHEGTGVGLTIAKKIVEIHNGKIWVESKVGEGSTFYFTIPKKKGV